MQGNVSIFIRTNVKNSICIYGSDKNDRPTTKYVIKYNTLKNIAMFNNTTKQLIQF